MRDHDKIKKYCSYSRVELLSLSELDTPEHAPHIPERISGIENSGREN